MGETHDFHAKLWVLRIRFGKDKSSISKPSLFVGQCDNASGVKLKPEIQNIFVDRVRQMKERVMTHGRQDPRNQRGKKRRHSIGQAKIGS